MSRLVSFQATKTNQKVRRLNRSKGIGQTKNSFYRKLRTGKRDGAVWKLRTGKRSGIVDNSYDDLFDDVDDVMNDGSNDDFASFEKRGPADSWKLRTGKRAANLKRENLWHLRAGRK